MYYICLGEVGFWGHMHVGNNPTNEFALNIFFMVATFMIMIIMMNFLIAKMGEIFSVNREIEE